MITHPNAMKILCALSSTPLHTSEISRRTNIPRMTVDYALRRLEKGKYVVSKKSGKKTVWDRSGWKDNESGISVIHGIDNIVKSFTASVNKKDLNVVIIESDESVKIFQNKTYHNAFQELHQKLAKMDALLYLLFHQNSIDRVRNMTRNKQIAIDTLKFMSNRAMSSCILPSNLFNLKLHITVFGDVTFLTDFNEDTSIRIVNKDLASFFKQIFDYISDTEHHVNVKEILNSIINEKRATPLLHY